MLYYLKGWMTRFQILHHLLTHDITPYVTCRSNEIVHMVVDGIDSLSMESKLDRVVMLEP
jgi:hypothetical protein